MIISQNHYLNKILDIHPLGGASRCRDCYQLGLPRLVYQKLTFLPVCQCQREWLLACVSVSVSVVSCLCVSVSVSVSVSESATAASCLYFSFSGLLASLLVSVSVASCLCVSVSVCGLLPVCQCQFL